jgi:hypothetical protein
MSGKKRTNSVANSSVKVELHIGYTTGNSFFAKYQEYSAKAHIRSAIGLPSVVLRKGCSAYPISAKPNSLSVTRQSLCRVQTGLLGKIKRFDGQRMETALAT